MNPHCQFIDKRISDLKKLTKWNTKIIASHEEIIKDFGCNVFTNLIQKTFTPAYLKKHPCSDCKEPAEERCHGIGEERLILLKRALEKVYADTTKPISLKEILIQFLEEHKTTKFTLKCSVCHRKESQKN
jgi:hypothetical protein